MMTLEEAIKHAEEIAEANDGMTDDLHAECRKCAEEHRQLAEWLKELKAYREKDDPVVTCITCKHYNEHPTGMLAVERWCRSPIWEKAGRAPHPIKHDGFKLIMCNYWEPKEEEQNDGRI